MTVTNSNSELTNRDDLLFGIVGVLLKIPPHHMHVACQGLQVVDRLLGTKIACTQYVLDPPRYQKLLELCREGRCPVRDVQIAKDKNKHDLLKAELFSEEKQKK